MFKIKHDFFGLRFFCVSMSKMCTFSSTGSMMKVSWALTTVFLCTLAVRSKGPRQHVHVGFGPDGFDHFRFRLDGLARSMPDGLRQVFGADTHHDPFGRIVFEPADCFHGQVDTKIVRHYSQDVPFAFQVGFEEVHARASDESSDEHVRRRVVQFQGRSDLLDESVLHHDDPVPHGHGFDLVVGDVNGRRREAFVEFFQFDAGLDPELGVEVRKRFVEEEDFGFF